MSADAPLVSYVVPAYQAESFIFDSLGTLWDACCTEWSRAELVVVNDGSMDRTADEVRRFIGTRREGSRKCLVDLPRNRGKGGAIMAGLAETQGDVVVFVDCDLPYAMDDVRKLRDTLTAGEADFAIASRMCRGSVYVISSGLLSHIYVRHTAGRLWNWITRLVAGLDIEDTQAGLKGMDAATAELMRRYVTVKGFAFDVEMLVCAARNGRTIRSVPVTFTYDSRVSTVSFLRQGFPMLRDLLRVLIRRKLGYYTRPRPVTNRQEAHAIGTAGNAS